MDLENTLVKNRGIVMFTLSELTQDVTAGIKEKLTLPANIDIVNMWIETATAPTNDPLIVDIKESSVSILNNKLIIDINKKSSKTSSTAYSLKQYTVSKDKELSFEVVSTDVENPCTGLKIFIECYVYDVDVIYNFLSFSAGGSVSQEIGETLVELGTIDYTDLNSASSGTKNISIVLANSKPADKYISTIFFQNTEAFTNYGYTNSIVSIAQTSNSTTVDISLLGSVIPNNLEDDVTIALVLDENNTQDWATGNIKVLATLKPYPAL
jgi:hypothetical protein